MEFGLKRDTCWHVKKKYELKTGWKTGALRRRKRFRPSHGIQSFLVCIYTTHTKLLEDKGVAGLFDWQDRLSVTTGNNNQGWLLSWEVEGGEREKGRGAAMDAERERGREGWPDRPRLVANITSPLGATTAATLIFLPPSSLYPPLCLTCTAFTRLSVCLAPCPAICVCWPLWWLVFFSSLCHHYFALPLLFVILWTSCIQNIDACLDVSLICRPCLSSVLYLSVLLCPLPPLPLTQLCPLLFCSPHSQFHCTYRIYVQRNLVLFKCLVVAIPYHHFLT